MNTPTKHRSGWGLGAGLAWLLVGCSQQVTRGTMPSSGQPAGSAKDRCAAEIRPTVGHDVRGSVFFSRVHGGVRVVADITGLKPGEHGFHIHEKGDCSAPDATSAGGHFNPTGMPHGSPDADKHHLGDLGNIVADPSGKAHLDRVFSFLDLDGHNTIVGHAVIVHQDKDDLTTQPTGNAGARVACGIITGP